MGSGTSSGIGGTANGGAASAGSMSKAQAAKLIANTPFTNQGNGTWSIDIDRVGGGQILDESDSAKNNYGAMGGKLYSYVVWNGEYTQQGARAYVGSLVEARAGIKEELKKLHGLRG